MSVFERPPLTPHEQTLRDEVVYLHSLWHQGPPTPNPNPLNYVNFSSRNLHVSNPKPFKKTYRNKARYRNVMANNFGPNNAAGAVPDPGPEWPVKWPQPSPTRSGSDWPAFKSNPRPSSRPVSEADQGKIAAMHMQQKFLKCCNQFLVEKVALNGNGDDELDEVVGDQYCSANDNAVEECEEFKFFSSLFVENQEIRDFYEKNTETGDFYCLVCGGTGETVYRGCAGLVQHAKAISETKRKRAHRAFCHFICKVLGWDISRLPMIVLKGEPLRHSLANSGQSENFSDDGDGKKIFEDLSNDVPKMNEREEGATECLGYGPPLVSDVQWLPQKPVDESLSTTVGWPSVKPHHPSNASADELERFAMEQLQRKFWNECEDFLTEQSGSICDEDEEDCRVRDVSDECEEFKFFLRLFTDSNELRNYYQKHYEGGEFFCLVCCALAKKPWRKFKGCQGLVNHATQIAKTKKKKAHRAYGHVMCKVLGWDVDWLPAIVLKGEPLMHSVEKPSTSLGEPINADCGHEDSSFPPTKTVHGNVSVSTSSDDSGIHKKKLVQSTSNGGSVNEHVNDDLERECIKANKLNVVDSKAKSKESGGSYKKQNMSFWVNNCCWPETKQEQSMRKANALEEGCESEKVAEGTDGIVNEQNTEGRDI